MSIELKVPSVGESITDVQIGEWLKSEGSRVERDDTLVKIETDKATLDLPAPATGVLRRILVKAGQPAAVGDVIAIIDEAGDAASTASGAADEAPPSTGTPSSRSTKDSIPAQGFARVMPSARRALKERGLKSDEVEGSGPGGRVLKEDVLRHLDDPPPSARPVQPEVRVPTRLELPQRPAHAEAPSAPEHGDELEEIVPMSPFRRRIAERLVQAQQTAALLTTFNEIDMSAVMALRKEHQEAFVARYKTKLGFMSFFVKAVIDGLKAIPALNAEIRGTDIVYKNHYDIGIAVGGGKGLAVPVVRNADRLSFAEVEQKVADFGKRAQESKLELQELQGGTFTISNGGVYGSLMSTPIVNPPQSGILGLHAIQDRVIAVNGAPAVKPMMYVALTYDHRLVDGREAVTFLKRIKQCIEEPARMLVEV
ncbi:MAG TPA: 2-oxoglutarate dehydrogenase complex dihydrolipoyllysine-residue succinyltransferase [Polyangiaceae bacterium]|nr:2-oxoglutarate dehydrogenase complex dihydrolipoyllysine-residue succinyltransferase [Polyangiaceae bacterium]